MATLKEFEIRRNAGKKDKGILDRVWDIRLEEGEWYDLVQIAINEIDGYFWRVSIGVKCGTTEEKIKDFIDEYIKRITDEDIQAYKNFIKEGEEWGWD